MTTNITTTDIKNHAESVYNYMTNNVIGEPFRFFYSNNKVEDNGYGDYVFHLVMNTNGNKLSANFPLSYSETTAAENNTYDPDLLCRSLRQTLLFDAFCTGSAAFYDTLNIQSVSNANAWAPSSDFPNMTELKIQTILGIPIVIHLELNL